MISIIVIFSWHFIDPVVYYFTPGCLQTTVEECGDKVQLTRETTFD